MDIKKQCFLFFLFPTICMAESAASDPCNNLLALINRPTVLDSPCVVKPGDVLLEMGYRFDELYPEQGNMSNFPEAFFRFGIPLSNEISVLMPNYVGAQLTDQQHITGATATVVGLKHQFPIFQNKWTYAAESLFTLPSGSDAVGSDGLGVAINGIVNYDIISSVAAAVMLGVTTETTSTQAGGQRFNSFNPSFVLSWQPLSYLQFLAEIYGQTKTDPDKSDGYNSDFAIQYLITENIIIDAEYGLRLGGELDGFSHYYGAGGGIRF